MKTITEYEIRNFGVDHAQYFPGLGTAFTDWVTCALGCGSTPYAALEDALEDMAMQGYDVEGIKNELSDVVPESIETANEEDESHELYCYVGLMVK